MSLGMLMSYILIGIGIMSIPAIIAGIVLLIVFGAKKRKKVM